MRLDAAIQGNLTKFLKTQQAAAEAAVTAGVSEIATKIKDDLRGQVTNAGLGAVRVRVFPSMRKFFISSFLLV
jgi:hypothetical protein